MTLTARKLAPVAAVAVAAEVGGLAPVNTVLPVVSGTTTVGQTLTTTDGTWDNNPTSFAYQWHQALTDGEGNVLLNGNGRPLGDPIVGATSSTYVLQAGDATEHIFCDVTATNASGSASISSDAVGPVSAAAGDFRIVSAGNARIVSAGNFRKVA